MYSKAGTLHSAAPRRAQSAAPRRPGYRAASFSDSAESPHAYADGASTRTTWTMLDPHSLISSETATATATGTTAGTSASTFQRSHVSLLGASASASASSLAASVKSDPDLNPSTLANSQLAASASVPARELERLPNPKAVAAERKIPPLTAHAHSRCQPLAQEQPETSLQQRLPSERHQQEAQQLQLSREPPRLLQQWQRATEEKRMYVHPYQQQMRLQGELG